MALRSEYALGHSEFNDFLFAFVGEEENGSQLTVLSALARLDLDPWGEAADLSKRTRKAATSELAAKIAVLPQGDWKKSDLPSIAGRLVDLLPRHALSPSGALQAKTLSDSTSRSDGRKRLIWIGVAAMVGFALWRLFSG